MSTVPIKLTNAQKDDQAFHRWLTKKHPGMTRDNAQYPVLRTAFIAGRQSGVASITSDSKRTLKLDILCVNHADQCITVLVNGKQYQYQFSDGFPLLLDRVTSMIKMGRRGQALAVLKQQSVAVSSM